MAARVPLRLVRFSLQQGLPRIGSLLADGNIVDLQLLDGAFAGHSSVRRCLEDEGGLRRAYAASQLGVQRNVGIVRASSAVRLHAPIDDPSKVIGIGLNYADHVRETGLSAPAEPVWFTKYASSIVGPHDAIVRPRRCMELDFEAELVFVVGRRARNVLPAAGADYIAGYMCGNDVSARDYQFRFGGGQWSAGKSCDTFAPLGPVLVTAAALGDDACALGIRTTVNEQVMQRSSTSQMIVKPAELLAYLSQTMTLMPGDVVFTGTPHGVGFARKPPVFLQPGDRVTVEIDGLGSLTNTVAAEEA